MGRLEYFISLGDFNCQVEEAAMKSFCETYNLYNQVVGPTCFKNPINPSSIDLMLTNKRKNFQNTIALETGLSDHKMTVSVMRSCCPKHTLTLVKYRNYKNFMRENFRNELQYKLLALNDDAKFEDFETIFMNILNKHAPTKEKLIRANNSPFMNKTMSKAIMTRSRLKNKFLKNPNRSEQSKLQ